MDGDLVSGTSGDAVRLLRLFLEEESQRELRSRSELRQCLVDLTGRIEAATAKLETVDKDTWNALILLDPWVLNQLCAALESLWDVLHSEAPEPDE